MDKGTQIAYVPTHAEGDLKHPDVQFGFVISTNYDGTACYCRYWNKELRDLRTKTNSELTPISYLVERESVPQAKVKMMLNMIELGFLNC